MTLPNKYADALRILLDMIRKAPPVQFVDVSDETRIGPVLIAVPPHSGFL